MIDLDVLVLRITAPLQSWGSKSKFNTRLTENEPTKSGIIGMIAAAFGWNREHPISELSENLRFGVREDRPGRHLIDYQVAREEKNATVTYRHYLNDAVFLVGLEGESDLIEKISNALKNPYYPLYLGRRSCPPSGKLVLDIKKDTTLEQILENYPLLAQKNNDNEKFRIIIEPKDGESVNFVKDSPVSFSQRKREYAYRGIEEYFVENPQCKNAHKTDHDPFTNLGGEDVYN